MYAEEPTTADYGIEKMARDRGAVPVTIERLEKLVSEARTAAERLIGSLNFVSRGGPGGTAMREGVPTPVRSPMANTLSELCDRLSDLTTLLTEADSALDL